MPTIAKERLLKLLREVPENYYELVNFFLDGDISIEDKNIKSKSFLLRELDKVNMKNLQFPSLDQLRTWFEQENKVTREAYQNYLGMRKDGGKRQYFTNTGQAFEFLTKIAPLKQVDGAWLYSAVNYWNNEDLHDLILIYLEELGTGKATANHVCLYHHLLKCLGLDEWNLYLEDEYYQQAAIQLALGYAPAEFLPEIMGYNLEYEQLPLHLLITNFELAELGIDSSYFNLHITIDNLDNGHADRSIKMVEKFASKYEDQESFYQKLKQGYALNQLGIGSTQIIRELNLNNFVHKILKKKAVTGSLIHNNKCIFHYKTVNEWLSSPEQVELFIEYLAESEWIKFGSDPEESRFWRLIHSESGRMFGVFNLAERQIIYDWIRGDFPSRFRTLSHQHTAHHLHEMSTFSFDYFSQLEHDKRQSIINHSPDISCKMAQLIPYLAPHAHHQKMGLWSAQVYTTLLFPHLIQL
ncbi:iron-containing redox enzyme family protein [Acinetobacter puyangensis]|uniref:Iron-containing redox enzyme n=1 Tax=Acinetobacter puyangensis TaxID=1096779 RepID=A0A240E583_9GAMM|nr:iron-containing redox enzyme family protein [Acinetobacter puyangensis]SNX43752.1 Iron-containing redox enzyme [Acinetobacter puyangensis]